MVDDQSQTVTIYSNHTDLATSHAFKRKIKEQTVRNGGSLTVQIMMHLPLDFPASSLKPHPSESISTLEVFLYYNTP